MKKIILEIFHFENVVMSATMFVSYLLIHIFNHQKHNRCCHIIRLKYGNLSGWITFPQYQKNGLITQIGKPKNLFLKRKWKLLGFLFFNLPERSFTFRFHVFLMFPLFSISIDLLTSNFELIIIKNSNVFNTRVQKHLVLYFDLIAYKL